MKVEIDMCVLEELLRCSSASKAVKEEVKKALGTVKIKDGTQKVFSIDEFESTFSEYGEADIVTLTIVSKKEPFEFIATYSEEDAEWQVDVGILGSHFSKKTIVELKELIKVDLGKLWYWYIRNGRLDELNRFAKTIQDGWEVVE